MNTDLKHSWGKWPDKLHELPNQVKSIAKIREIENFTIEREQGYMDVVSSSDNKSTYRTTLENCECRDFLITKKKEAPCKHMYKLAYECGFRNFDVERSDIYKLVEKKCKALNSKQLKELAVILDKKFGKEIQ